MPSNIVSHKKLEALWRPQLSVVGVIAHGHLEAYYLMRLDIHLDGNMEASVSSGTPDIVQEKLKAKHESYCMPKSLLVNADNTPREANTSIFHTYAACLESERRLDGTQTVFLKGGIPETSLISDAAPWEPHRVRRRHM